MRKSEDSMNYTQYWESTQHCSKYSKTNAGMQFILQSFSLKGSEKMLFDLNVFFVLNQFAYILKQRLGVA